MGHSDDFQRAISSSTAFRILQTLRSEDVRVHHSTGGTYLLPSTKTEAGMSEGTQGVRPFSRPSDQHTLCGPGTPFACFACDHCSDYAYRSCAHCGEVCSTPTPGLGGHKLPTCFTFPHFLDHTCRDLTSDRADDALEGHSRPRLSAMPQATMQAPGGAIVWLQSVVLCKFGLQDIVLRNMWRRGQPRQWSLESRQPVSAMEQAWTAQRSIRRPSGRRPRSNHCS